MSDVNPMVPSINWGEAAKAFEEAFPHGDQVILCVQCVVDLGLTTAPSQVVIWEGKSLCLDHLHQLTDKP